MREIPISSRQKGHKTIENSLVKNESFVWVAPAIGVASNHCNSMPTGDRVVLPRNTVTFCCSCSNTGTAVKIKWHLKRPNLGIPGKDKKRINILSYIVRYEAYNANALHEGRIL